MNTKSQQRTKEQKDFISLRTKEAMTFEIKQKISLRTKEALSRPEVKQKMIQSKIGHPHPHKGHSMSIKHKHILLHFIKLKKSNEHKEKISKAHLGKKLSIEHKKKLSLSHIGHIPSPNCFNWKKSVYKGILFKSSWELEFAKFFDEKNIKWKYESKTFFFKNTSYTPDFYLPEYNQYIEVKGWFPINVIHKYKLFKKFFPEIKINIVRGITDFHKIRLLQKIER